MRARKRRLKPAERLARGQRLIAEILAFLKDAKGWRFCYANLTEGSQTLELLKEKDPLAGQVYFFTQIMLLDYSGDVLSTIAHECLHILYPRTLELTIRAMERDVIRAMTPTQAAQLHKRSARYAIGLDEFIINLLRELK